MIDLAVSTVIVDEGSKVAGIAATLAAAWATYKGVGSRTKKDRAQREQDHAAGIIGVDEFRAFVDQLQEENSSIRADRDGWRRRSAECEEQNDELRRRLREIESGDDTR